MLRVGLGAVEQPPGGEGPADRLRGDKPAVRVPEAAVVREVLDAALLVRRRHRSERSTSAGAKPPGLDAEASTKSSGAAPSGSRSWSVSPPGSSSKRPQSA